MEILALILYIIILISIGYIVKSKIKSTDDYIIGGRKIPWLLITASLAANDIGSGASLGIIQTAVNDSSFAAAWYIWLMIPAYIIGFFVAPYMRKTKSKTVPDFFRKRYGNLSQKLSALFIIIPNIGVIAINFTASASILHIILGINFIYALIISVTITSLYSYFGGIFADMYNDVIQLIILLTGFCLTAFYLSQNNDVDLTIISNTLTNQFDFSKSIELIILYSSVFILGLSTTTRIYSSKSVIDIKKGIFSSIPIYLLYAIIPAYIGFVLSTQHIGNNDVNSILSYLNLYLPKYVFICLFLGIIAASLSTVDTLLIGCAAMLINDILPDRFSKISNEKRKLIYLRLIVIIFALIAFFITIIGIEDIIKFLLFLLSLQTSVLIVPFIYGHLNNKIISEKQCIIAILFSLLIFSIMSVLKIEIYFINPLFCAIFGGVLVFVICNVMRIRES
jgi:SSS family solute:Na+ symporter